jgi:hypothetical protein
MMAAFWGFVALLAASEAAAVVLLCAETTSTSAEAEMEQEPRRESEAGEQTPDDETSKTAEEETDEEEARRLEVYERIEVRDREDDLVGIATAASEGSIGLLDLENRPLLRAGELVETVPGVIATQHSGGGKANQYFLRGFNLDHGTDLSLRVGGVPVNMPSHGHGQGYTDLNFMIPELVERVRYRKGTYSAAQGDFSAAGSVEMDYVSSLSGPLVSVAGGENGYRRLLAADSFRLGNGELLGAIEGFHNDGPWTRGDDYERLNLHLGYYRGDANRGFSLQANVYSGDWLATDQIPRRAVNDGTIGRFDLIDPGPRGATDRYSLMGEAHWGGARSYSRLLAYALSYDFGLFSDFTYLLDDPENGDQFEQADERQVLGLDWAHSWLASLGGKAIETSAGVEVRYDSISTGLYRTRELVRTATTREDSIDQLQLAPYVDLEARLGEKIRAHAGLRFAYLDIDVRSDLEANSDDADDELLLPKLGLVFGPWRRTEIYLDLGHGYHSNDARGATIRVDPVTGAPAERVPPLVRAEGYEVGVRTTVARGLHTSLALYQLELDSELVFIGDGGSTEATRPSRRNGIEWATFYRINDWLTADFDLTIADAHFRDDDPAGDQIPGAIEKTIASGLTFDGPGKFFGALRWRYFADVPLIEDGSVVWDSSSLVNGSAGYELGAGIAVELEVFNLLDAEDSDIEYFYPSRLPGEQLEGVEDVHFHPIESRSARIVLTWRG